MNVWTQPPEQKIIGVKIFFTQNLSIFLKFPLHPKINNIKARVLIEDCNIPGPSLDHECPSAMLLPVHRQRNVNYLSLKHVDKSDGVPRCITKILTLLTLLACISENLHRNCPESD